MAGTQRDIECQSWNFASGSANLLQNPAEAESTDFFRLPPLQPPALRCRRRRDHEIPMGVEIAVVDVGLIGFLLQRLSNARFKFQPVRSFGYLDRVTAADARGGVVAGAAGDINGGHL